MTSQHPIWETTKDEQEVPVRVLESVQQPIPAAKRSAAALVGMFLMGLLGFSYFGGMDIFSAQVSTNDSMVTIATSGVLPLEISIEAGKSITWKNADVIPHILESRTLKDSKGIPMETTAIFPGSELTFTIPAETPDGTYTYESKTSKSIAGSIIVQNTKQIIPQAVSSMPTNAANISSTTSRISEASVSSASSISSSTQTTVDTSIDIIPYNPNTVANATNLPVTKNIQTTEITTHRPRTNTESGSAHWILAFAGISAFTMVMRRSRITHKH